MLDGLLTVLNSNLNAIDARVSVLEGPGGRRKPAHDLV
jgi:hypothetical protein